MFVIQLVELHINTVLSLSLSLEMFNILNGYENIDSNCISKQLLN